MLNKAIEVKNLNKKFKSGYGIFDINFTVEYGKVFGYLGPNGAGKSTTIRSLMGFIKADSGSSNITYKNKNEELINDIVSYDSWVDSNKVQRNLGYVPGEISFPIHMTGIDLLKQIFRLRNMSDWNDVRKLIDYWEFNPNMKIKKMSKGMKQKVALVIAWMHNPDIIVLDEPTTGLDPLMQDKFVKLVQKSKEEGKAIILSSHIFSEIEKTCDYVAIIKRGKIVSTVDVKDIQYNEEKTYEIKFKNEVDEQKIISHKWKVKSFENNIMFVVVENKDINDFIQTISHNDIEFIKEHPLDLEQYFMKYYQNEIEKDVIEKLDNIELKSGAKKSFVSFELIKDTSRKSFWLWFFMTIIPTIMSIVVFSVMFNNQSVLDKVASGVSWEIIINGAITSLITSTTGIAYLLILVYLLVTGNSLVAGEVEKGTMVNLLTTNQSRKSVLLTKMLTHISFLVLSIFILFITSISTIGILGKGSEINFGLIGMYFIGLFLIILLMSSISFLSSCYFNKSAYSLATAGGIAIIFYVLYFVSKINESVEFLKYFSLNTLFTIDYTEVGQVGKYLGQYLSMFILSIGLYTTSYFVFTKKDLPL